MDNAEREVKMPQLKRKVMVEKEPYPYSYRVWGDENVRERMKQIPGVNWHRRMIEGYDIVYIQDPRYDVAGVIAAIEALGGSDG